MTLPPAASMRAAAAITSITMNGGTSLRAEGVISRFAASSIVQALVTGFNRPAVAVFGGFRAIAGGGAQSRYQLAAFGTMGGAPLQVRSVYMVSRARRACLSPQLLGQRMIETERRMASTDRTSTTGSPRMAPSRWLTLLTTAAFVAAGFPTQAQNDTKGPPVIRDAEIEQLLREYTQPVLRVAGLAKQNVQVVIINDRSFNAFVADGRRIFINAGALMDAETPNQVIGVLAHETGHIAGGHLARMREQLAAASTQSIIGLLLGVGAMVAASRSGSVSGANAGMAAIQAPQAMIQNSLLAYVRTQEDAADRAGVKFLSASGQSAKGMSDTFKRLADQQLYSVRYIDPYMQSHPMPADRVRSLEELARTSPYWDKKDAPALQARHDLMRAKLFGFMDRPDAVAR